jgi:hypothetical protein
MKPQIVIDKVLTGESNEEETLQLKEWLLSNSENTREFAALTLLYSRNPLSDIYIIDTQTQQWHQFVACIQSLEIRRRIRNYLIISTCLAFLILALLAIQDRHIYASSIRSTHTFANEPIREVMNNLFGSRFDLTFCAKESKLCTFTGTFKKGTSYRQAVETLAKATNLRIVYSDTSAIYISCGAFGPSAR